ncbi:MULTISPECIES: hypothetical protein [unclassified Siphonobacter]|uniref:hypothetical protein n=1 Tax=unclassified Siphonobacter TaxID=2635712 RepID=UPI00277DF1FA|nr:MULTISPECIES: hypothetical protein [unclassified Siphonobacter]MDQ1089992.1 hypothetical protein [Siphonobacter sp. SORGH_AS_1065]MDR6197459.1 hypothetical protein [Siphonobacter sp. SORGH_AS_0500]
MAISSAPKKKAPVEVVNEDEIMQVINRGGSTTRSSPEPPQPEELPKVTKTRKSAEKKVVAEVVPEVLKRFSIELTESETDMIKQLRTHRPQRGRARKITISVTDWIVEAVQEKIEREKRKYGVD